MEKRDEKGRFLVGTDPGPGRSSSYDPAMNEQAFKLALLGMTDKEIARFFGITEQTLNVWKHEHSGFYESLNAGRDKADAEVAKSLYRRATGTEVFEERLAHRNGVQEVVRVRKEIPPDPGAAALWLSIRQRRRWAQKVEDRDPPEIEGDENQHELTASKPLQDATTDELEERLRILRARLEME